MKKITKEDISQEVFDLYDDYAHDRVSRRLFLDKLSTYAVGGLTVASLLSFISPDYVKKIQIRQDDKRLKSDYINYHSPKGAGSIKGLLSKPADATGKLPGIVVVHENRGLNPPYRGCRQKGSFGRIYFAGTGCINPPGRISGK